MLEKTSRKFMSRRIFTQVSERNENVYGMPRKKKNSDLRMQDVKFVLMQGRRNSTATTLL